MAFVQQWIQSCRPFESSESHFVPDPSCYSSATVALRSQHISQSPRDYVQAEQQAGDMFSTLSVSDHPSLIDHPSHSILPSGLTSTEPLGQPGREHQHSMEPTFWYTLDPSYQYHPFPDSPLTTATVHPAGVASASSVMNNNFSPWSSSEIPPQSLLEHQSQQRCYSPLPRRTHPKFEATPCQQLDPLSALVNPWTNFYHQAIVSPSLSSSSSATSKSSSSSSTPSCAGSSPPIVHFSMEASSNPTVLYPEAARTSGVSSGFEFSYPFQQPSYISAVSPSSSCPSTSYNHPSEALPGNLMAPVAHKFAPRASSILTRRQSTALTLKNTLGPSRKSPSFASLSASETTTDATTTATASAPTTHGRSSVSTSSSSSPSSLPSSTVTCTLTLTCQVCKKRYANNSTLRRHLKIHAYANSTNRSLSLLRSSGHGIGGGSSVSRAARHLLSVPSSHGSGSSSSPSLPSALVPPFRVVEDGPHGYAALSSSLPIEGIGYSPGSDPDIKKPECVGCNKAFARRDTVILHIKNKKRKWDLLNAMLPALTSCSDDTSSVTTSSISMAMMEGSATSGGDGSGGGGGGRRIQRQRKSHPYRMVEKLWQSTLQKKGLLLTASPSSARPATTTTVASSSCLSSVSRYGLMEGVKLESNGMGFYPVALGGYDGNDDNEVEDNDGDDDEDNVDAMGGEEEEAEEEAIGEDGWPSLETMSRMDSQIKLRWMMKMMVMPPCWTERKVRLFGAFGVMEEKVLQ